ncbi:MAG: class IV adenylate cyclase [Candidatus Saccharibacteria bacterium]
MREIEIKARASDVPSIIEAITRQGGIVSEAITHHDRVYGLPGVPGASENNEPWLRIRGETKAGVTKYLFTLKKSVTNQLDSIEHETEVANEMELEKIIEHMNFVPYSDLTKTRRKAQLGDVEVCLDYLDGLGDFIELEKLTSEEADYDGVARELWGMLESFGVSKAQEVTDGYDVLMNKHLGIE